VNEAQEPAPWEGLYDTFMPLLISMTFNSPLQFWELNYMQQHDKFEHEEGDQNKLVTTTGTASGLACADASHLLLPPRGARVRRTYRAAWRCGLAMSPFSSLSTKSSKLSVRRTRRDLTS
jgi:hypothetical protein